MKITKTGMIALLTASALLALNPASHAADTNTPPKTDAPPAENRPGGPRMSPEQRLVRWTEELKLTDEQKPKVKALLEEQAKAMAGARELPQEERRAKMRAAREEMGAKLKPILTEEQYKKWEAMPQRGGGRPQGGGDQRPPNAP